MSIPDEAKKAVECLPAMLQYLDGHAPEDLNTLIPMQFNHATWSAIIATLESTRPVATGESVIVSKGPIIQFFNHNWSNGFATFINDPNKIGVGDNPFCTINLGAFIACVKTGELSQSELPYYIARSMMHEIIHVLEKWASVEFSEEKVESLLVEYDSMITVSQE
jgi:hypothetical protein